MRIKGVVLHGTGLYPIIEQVTPSPPPPHPLGGKPDCQVDMTNATGSCVSSQCTALKTPM